MSGCNTNLIENVHDFLGRNLKSYKNYGKKRPVANHLELITVCFLQLKPMTLTTEKTSMQQYFETNHRPARKFNVKF